MVVENPTELVLTMRGTDHRDWWETTGSGYKKISDWVSLNVGEHYYIEGQHLEGNGGDHFAAAVEIEQSEIVGHHHAMKEIQYVSVQAEQTYELTRINITNKDDGQFLLLFQNPNDLKVNRSLPISASASAAELLDAVKDYYIYNPYILS
jgi:hypothetical protein